MQRSIWCRKKELEAQEAAGIHDVVALADVAVGVVDEPLDVSMLETPRGGEGSSAGSWQLNDVDGGRRRY